eukprot:gene3046-2028_t
MICSRFTSVVMGFLLTLILREVLAAIYLGGRCVVCTSLGWLDAKTFALIYVFLLGCWFNCYAGVRQLTFMLWNRCVYLRLLFFYYAYNFAAWVNLLLLVVWGALVVVLSALCRCLIGLLLKLLVVWLCLLAVRVDCLDLRELGLTRIFVAVDVFTLEVLQLCCELMNTAFDLGMVSYLLRTGFESLLLRSILCVLNSLIVVVVRVALEVGWLVLAILGLFIIWSFTGMIWVFYTLLYLRKGTLIDSNLRFMLNMKLCILLYWCFTLFCECCQSYVYLLLLYVPCEFVIRCLTWVGLNFTAIIGVPNRCYLCIKWSMCFVVICMWDGFDTGVISVSWYSAFITFSGLFALLCIMGYNITTFSVGCFRLLLVSGFLFYNGMLWYSNMTFLLHDIAAITTC